MSGGACYNCGESGHFSRECPKQRGGGGGGGGGRFGGGGGGGMTCYNCNQQGHMSRECTEPRVSGGGGGGGFGGGGGGRGGMTCYNCNKCPLPHCSLWGYILQTLVQGFFSSVIASTDTFYAALIIKVGADYVQKGAFSAVELWIVFFMVQNLSQTIASVLGGAEDIVRAFVSVGTALGLLDEPVDFDCTDETGLKPAIEGEMKLNKVKFVYPSRPDTSVLKGISTNIRKGKTVAVVGPSGSGKSTIVHLLQRLYDPVKGDITLDGYNLTELNVRHLRNAVVPVKQEPTLFDGTIADNITYGMDLVEYTMDDITKAAQMANIYDFVRTLPEAFSTEVGEKGVQLSGGQKQRVCIARALIRNPKVLLLDEATASLDTENEKVVQAALEVARKERTCLVVAHRLSTVKSAHMILVMQQGKIVERGNHQSLLDQRGLYYELCSKQKLV